MDSFRLTIRFLAVANIILGAVGILLQADSALRFYQRNSFSAPAIYDASAYWIMAGISFVFACLTLLSGIPLWRNVRSALRFCNWVFGSLLVYWLGTTILNIALMRSKGEQAHQLGIAMAGASGIANMGTALQSISFYPVWALALLNFIYWRKQKAGLANPPT